MKKTVGCASLVLIFSFLAASAFAQDSPIKYGAIPLEDLQMTHYAPDSSAVAVILADFGQSYTFGGGYRHDRHVRIKILKNKGLSWANFQIPFSSATQKISNLKAATVNLENGNAVETELAKENIFEVKVFKTSRLQKFTLPNVRVGSILEISYTITSAFRVELPDWQIQYDIPVNYSEYRLFFHKSNFEMYLTGTVPVKDYIVTDRGSRWIITNVPAFKSEPYVRSEEECISKIHFSFAWIHSWDAIATGLIDSESFGEIIYKGTDLKDITAMVIAGKSTPEEKLESIFNYLRNNIVWDEVEDFLADNPKKIFKEKKGSSGDINIVMAGMLNQAGIEAHMVLLSTQDHGSVRDYFPTTRQFNYAVCQAKIGEKEFLLDATTKQYPMGLLPERCLNGVGLRVTKNQIGWLPLAPKRRSKQISSFDLKMSANGELAGTLNIIRDGYLATAMRNEILRDGKEEYLKDLTANNSWEIESSSFENLEQLNVNPTETHSLIIRDAANANGPSIYLNPILMSWMDSNPFMETNRKYPVDFSTPFESTVMVKIQIPEGYVVESLPSSKASSMPENAGVYRYNITQNNQVLTIVSMVVVNKTHYVPPVDYLQLREFVNVIIAKQAEQIVLKKKT